jgi:hypothetical protein
MDNFKQPNPVFWMPFFIEKIDISKLEFKEEPEYKPTFISRTPTTMEADELTQESYNYLGRILWECIGQYTEKPFYIGSVWRNKYEKTDWQDPHIHSGAQWSFVIYVDVEESKTVFLSPSRHNQMNQWGYLGHAFPIEYMPKVSSENIIIFPSFIEHFVPPGNEGITISGNIYYDQPPGGPV